MMSKWKYLLRFWRHAALLLAALSLASLSACGSSASSAPPPVAPGDLNAGDKQYSGGKETNDLNPPPNNSRSDAGAPDSPANDAGKPDVDNGTTNPSDSPDPSAPTQDAGEQTPPPMPGAGFKQSEACSDPIDPGTCKLKGSPRFAWDVTLGRCVMYIHYCSSSRNNFATMDACRQSCPSTNGACFSGDRSYANGERFMNDCNECVCENGKAICTFKKCPPKKPDYCYSKPETGSCKADFARWYYDADSNTCKTFSYGGCDGNKNNFVSEADCLQGCGD